MPIPKPKPQESLAEFMSRCMGDAQMEKEYPNDRQRVAVCARQWKEK
jgi:hypothetical protein